MRPGCAAAARLPRRQRRLHADLRARRRSARMPTRCSRTAGAIMADRAGADQRQGHDVASGWASPAARKGSPRSPPSRWCSRMSRLVATFFGVGYLRPAPAPGARPRRCRSAWLLHALGGFPAVRAATLAVFAVGIVGDRGGDARSGRTRTPAEIVIDEVVGQWIALWPLSAGLWHAGADPWMFPWPGWVGGFVMFRLFDIWKPGPVGWADRAATPGRDAGRRDRRAHGGRRRGARGGLAHGVCWA